MIFRWTTDDEMTDDDRTGDEEQNGFVFLSSTNTNCAGL